MSRTAIVAMCLAAALSAAVSGQAFAADPPDVPKAPLTAAGVPPEPVQKPVGLSSAIALLLHAAQAVPDGTGVTEASLAAADSGISAYIDTGLVRLDGEGRVQVYIRVSRAGADVLGGLESMGAAIERLDESGTLVQATVPVLRLSQLADLEYVTVITAPNYGHVNAGAALTQGDAILGFDDLRATLGVTGAGVTVGVISDGIFGLATALASGDLPPTTLNRVGGRLVSTTGGLIATSFRADGNLEGGLGVPTGAEGTAILEIVHDIAPGAQLRFANFSTDLDFIAAVDFLAANSDVVIDDIGFYGLPYDQTSNVSSNTAAELNRTANPIRGYYTSVGNQAQRHYQELYVESGIDGLPLVGQAGNFHLFQATGDTTDCLDLDLRVANLLLLSPGDTAVITLNWDDTFGAATTNYDLFILDNDTGAVVASSVDDNPGVTREPVEVVAFTDTPGGSGFYDIIIQNFDNASPAKTFDMFIVRGGIPCPNGSIFVYNTLRSSVPAQSDAGGGVVSAGAIFAGDPGANDIESFSSRGPTNNGAVKPDVTAIDGVSITGAGGFPNPFFGTSAAAPHLAGLAALLLDLIPHLLSGEPGDDPAADRAALREAIVGTAFDLGAPGVDNTYGSGRVRGLEAGLSLLDLASIDVTPDPASVASGLTLQLSATGVFTDESTTDLTATSTWTSSNPAVATVDAAGRVTGVTEGTTNIAATVGAISGSVALTVTPPEVASIAVFPSAASISKGLTVQYSAISTLTDGNTGDVSPIVAWDSSDSSVASISGAGLATGMGLGATSIRATLDGVSGETSLTVTPPVLASIVVTPDPATVARGLSLQLSATGVFTDDTAVDHTATSTWDSSNPAVATVDATGLVTGVAEGVTNITASVAAISGSAVLTVTSPEVVSIAVFPASSSVPKGLTLQYSASGTFSDSSTGDVSPLVTWSSSNSAVASIGSTGLAVGLIEGATSISASIGSISGTTSLTVTPPVLASVAVTPDPAIVARGLTLQLSATGILTDSSTRDRTASATWSSSNVAAATIDASGLASAIAQGTTTISAMVEGITGLTVLTVTPPELASVAVTPDPGFVAKGLALQFSVTGTFTDDSTGDVSTLATWSSSNLGVASVELPGLAVGVELGTTIISALVEGLSGSSTLTVTPPTLVSIAVTPESPVVGDGRVQFAATGTLSDGTSRDLTRLAAWASSAPSVATIDGTGRALVAGEGVTTVTATLDGLVGSALLTVPEVIPIPSMSTWGLMLAVAGAALVLWRRVVGKGHRAAPQDGRGPAPIRRL